MSSYKEYPKVMKHPQHQPAVWETLPGKGTGLFAPDTVMKSPERFPDVTVHTIDQEKQYAARGYRPANMGVDAKQYEQAILEAEPVDGYTFNEYPKWKYHAFEVPKIVHSKEEETALGEGWSDRPVEATEDDLAAYAELEAEPQANTGKRGRKPAHA